MLKPNLSDCDNIRPAIERVEQKKKMLERKSHLPPIALQKTVNRQPKLDC